VKACSAPVAFETLVAWWTGELAGDEAARVEEHVFACDACARALEGVANLAAGLREHLPPILSHAHRDRLVAGGARIRVTPVEAGIDARARFGDDVDLLVHALRADLARAERVDVEIVASGFRTSILCEGVPFDAKAGEVLICCQRHFQRLSPSDPTFRVYAFEGGQRRRVGDYLVIHEWS
jgi:hypothetical protein